MRTRLLIISILVFVSGVFAQTNIYDSFNGNFELGSIANWRAVEVAGGVALSIENDVTTSAVSISNDSNSDNFAAQFIWGVDPTIADVVFDLNTSVLPNTNYIFRASAKSLSGTAVLRIHCTFYNSSGGIVGDYNDMTWLLGSSYDSHEWAIPASPLGSSYAVIGFRVFNTDGSRWPSTAITTLIDDVQLWENYVEVNLSTNIIGSGSGSVVLNPVSVNGTYPEGTQVTITAIPDVNSEFISWGGDVSSVSNPLIITMNGNKSVTATIDEVVVSENIISSLNGYFELGSIANWRAIEVAGGNILSIENESTVSSVEITNDANNGNYAAQLTWGVDSTISDILFDLNTTILPSTNYIYKVSAKSLSGACLLRIHCTFYNSTGTIVGDYNDLTLQLSSTFTDHEWIIPESPVGSSYAVIGFRVFNSDGSRWPSNAITTVIDDVQLWKNFVGEEYVLSTDISGSGHGSLTLDPPGGVYSDGTQVTVFATPYYESEFDYWNGDVSDISNPIVITMDGHKSITANLTDQILSSVKMTTNSNTGKYAAQFTWKLDSVIEDLVFDLKPTVLPETNYIFKASAKSLSGSCLLRLHCTFYDISGGIIGDYNDETWLLTDSFQEHQWNIPESPIGSSFAVVGFRVYNADGSRWPTADITTVIDNVQLWENFIGDGYELTTSTSGTGTGIIVVDPVGVSYPAGTQVTVSVIPDNNSEFVSWSGSANSTSNPLVITMDGDKNIVALINETFNETNIFDGWNGDFELGNIQHWRALEVADGVALSIENDITISSVVMSSDSYSGNYAAQLTWGVSQSIADIVFDLNVPVLPQTDYVFKAVAKSLDPSILRIHCTFYNSLGTIIGDYNDASWQLTSTYQEHDWEMPNSPIGSSFAVVGFRLFNTNGSRWPLANVTTIIDDVQLWERVPVASSSEVRNGLVDIFSNENKELSYLIAYPNPTKSSTILNYKIDKSSKVKLSIYNITGSLIDVLVDQNQSMGEFKVVWNGTSLPNGIYYVRLESNDNTQNIKVILNK